MKAETYYAIRIGDPRHHRPYLMPIHGSDVPELFKTKSGANAALKEFSPAYRKVVPVKVQYQG